MLGLQSFTGICTYELCKQFFKVQHRIHIKEKLESISPQKKAPQPTPPHPHQNKLHGNAAAQRQNLQSQQK